MRSNAPVILLGAALTMLAGCASANITSTESSSVHPGFSGFVFSDPVQLTVGGYGYEPSVAVGPDGTLYVTAHKQSVVHEGERLASWLWYSRDDGRTWRDLPSPAQAHKAFFGFEGDLAVDAKGRVYYVDTYVAENSVSRWSTTKDGPAWDWTRPAQGTTGADDRPWLDAQGDGIVYYLGNTFEPIPGPENLAGGRTDGSRDWLYVSTDGGVTWSLGQAFGGTGWCNLAASPADDRSVYVVCYENDDVLAPGRVIAHASHDRGGTWAKADLGNFTNRGRLFPSTAVDRDGHAYASWIDGRAISKSEGQPTAGKLYLARESVDHRWTTLNVTPFEGAFEMVWVSAGSQGHVAVTFYGTRDVPVSNGSVWYPFALLSTDALAPAAHWQLVQLDTQPSEIGTGNPGDFFQSAFGPDDAVSIAFHRSLTPGRGGSARPGCDVTSDVIPGGTIGSDCDVMFVTQVENAGIQTEALKARPAQDRDPER